MTGLLVLFVLFQCCQSFRNHLPPSAIKFSLRRETYLEGKKDKKFQDKKGPAAPSKGEKQGQKDRFDALTRQFMFTIQGLTKTLPDGSRTILKNINLCFYPGAKIGVVGLNGRYNDSPPSSPSPHCLGCRQLNDGYPIPI